MTILFHVPDSTPAGIGGIDEYTVLMMHLDGDQSDSQHVITHNGDPEFSTAQSKFGGSSMYFDGTGDYLEIPDHNDWDFGGDDFTIDFWVNFTSSLTNQQWLVFQWPGAAPYRILYLQNGKLYYTDRDGGVNGADMESDAGIFASTGVWYHVAFVRNGSNPYLFIDGVSQNLTVSDGFDTMVNISSPLIIGGRTDRWLDGYIQEVRISNMARWTTGFTPSTEPYTSDANTKLLLHMNGDVSDGTHVVTSNGNPQLNATITKFDGAMYFDGNGDYLTIPDSDDWDFGAGDFTIDYWEYRTNATINLSTIARDTSSGVMAFLTGWSAGGVGSALGFLASSNGSTWDIANNSMGVVTLNTWIHYAIVRSGNTWYIFRDGVQTDTWTNSGTLLASSNALSIGVYNVDKYFQGYIDELRISNKARWTSNFTPESGPYTI
ncbi:MAG: hypothetical protein DRI98_08080 [Bacteroidetes bacterium]|nr:MAG: hypothetical protein DRI98_08080 [Bacteroidota bacterium]